MKVIFLDVDGVLNAEYSKSRCGECLGVDSDKVKRLKNIVDATGAEIVLSSTWRLGYNKDHNAVENHAKYLSNKLGKQHLRSVGMTPDLGRNGALRGSEIKAWLDRNDDIVDEYVILDDEYFADFYTGDLYRHLVRTDFYDTNGGLQDEHVEQAIRILNGELNEERVKEEKEDKAS